MRRALAFVLLFAAYELPEGLGLKVLHSPAVNAVLMLAFLPAAWVIARLVLRERFAAAYALEPRVKLLAGLFALAVFAKAIAVAVGLHAGSYTRGEPRGILLAVAAGLVTTFFPSIAEDLLTRGFPWRALPQLRGAAFVFASAALYVLSHVYRLSNGPWEWSMLFVFGLAYGAALARTGSLWAAVGLHWGWNFANAVGDGAQLWAAPASTPQLRLLSIGAHVALLAAALLVPRRGGWNSQALLP